MKKKLRIIVITSVLMLLAMGALLWKAGQVSKQQKEKQEKALAEERDTSAGTSKVINKVNEVDRIPLYLSGQQKNVVTVDYQSVEEIYEGKQGDSAEKTLTNIKKNQSLTFHDPLWAYNPYGTNPQSMYVYFKTSGKAYCKYTISVDDTQIGDFTRTALNNAPDNLSKEHEYQIFGLLPGRTNYITLQLYNKDDELSDTATWKIDLPADETGLPQQLSVEKGYSKQTISNGLYTVFSEGTTGKDGKKHYAILLYDNSGVLRAHFPTDSYVGKNMQVIYDALVYECSADRVVSVNSLGQVTHSYPVYGYTLGGEYAYDGSGSLYMIATAGTKNATRNTKILKLELESGDVSQALDMDEVLSGVYKKIRKKSPKTAKNWLNIDSLQCTGTNQLLLSSSKMSGIFKVSQVGSLLPKLEYIISDPKLWKSYKSLSKKVLTKALADGQEPDATATPVVDSILDTPAPSELFDSQYGQNAITYTRRSDTQYELEMLNNNTGTGAKAGQESQYYKYLVDEEAGTYQLKTSKELSAISGGGNVLAEDKVWITAEPSGKMIRETDKQDKLIRKYTLPITPYRVDKSDWKGFWFY